MLFVPPHEEPSDEEIDLANQIRGVLKPFGLLAGKGSGRPFIERVRALVADGPLQEVAEALLSAWQAINGQVGVLSRRLIVIARATAYVTLPGQRFRHHAALSPSTRCSAQTPGEEDVGMPWQPPSSGDGLA